MSSDGENKKQTTSNFKSFTSGGVGGVAAVLVGQFFHQKESVQLEIERTS